MGGILIRKMQMAKIISRRLLPPDDPMFSGGFETFSIRRLKQSTKTSQKNTDGDAQKLSPSNPSKTKFEITALKK